MRLHSVVKDPNQTTYHYGDTIQLTANADTGWTFDSWSGHLTGSTNPETLTVTANMNVTATFTQNVSVVKDPNQTTYHYGDTIQLTANADTGWTFDSWSGHLTGSTNPETLTVTGDMNVTATFAIDQMNIFGYITESDANIPVEGVFVDANNGGGSDITSANGYYQLTVDYGWSGTVEPNKTNYTFEPPRIEYDNVTTDQNDNYTAIFGIIPSITSIAPTTATVYKLYSYDVNAIGIPEPNYSLVVHPAGMIINSISGLIRWSPISSHVGTGHTVEVRASNTAGFDSESFVVAVSGIAPSIGGVSAVTATVGRLYSYGVYAGGVPHPNFMLLEAPEGMTIDADIDIGLIRWTPTEIQLGINVVTVRAVNSEGHDDYTYEITVYSDDPVSFADPNLKGAVEEALGVSDPLPEDMLHLNRLYAQHRGIRGLTGLEYAVNLETLILHLNEINDLSPLSNLINLENLYLMANEIEDVSDLAGLVNLSILDVGDNRICSLSPLSGLVNLTVLHAGRNEIDDIGDLSGMTNLWRVLLYENQISDISSLSGLDGIIVLVLFSNEVVDISALSELANLRSLHLSTNKWRL